MSFSLVEIWHSMGLAARLVAGVLLVMGLASLTVFVERVFTLRRSRRLSIQFANEIAEDLNAGVVERVVEAAGRFHHGALARLIGSGLEVYLGAARSGERSDLSPSERAKRHLHRKLEVVGAELRRGMAILSSVGSVAPFVGLLGTVLGIISSFQGIAATGSGGLSSVSAGISEALIETAFGLAVAIPAVLCVNSLSTMISRDELALETAAGELADTLESWGAVEPRAGRRERVA